LATLFGVFFFHNPESNIGSDVVQAAMVIAQIISAVTEKMSFRRESMVEPW
jgi:hypothetical protein